MQQGSGNVGVATSAPATTFSVGGNGYFDNAIGIGGVNTTAHTILIGADANPAYASFGAGRGYIGFDGEGAIGVRVQGSSGRGIAFDVNNNSFGSGEVARITSGGLFGIGTTTPYSRLTVWGPDTASSTLAFNIVNNASTTVFAVFNGGNAQLSGTLTQSSDARLKTNIQSLDASTSLAAINSLTPVAYDWLDPEKGGVRQYGFIAQQVQQVFPNLVSTTSPTALTPDGTLGLNYLGLIAPLVEAVQTLSAEVQSSQLRWLASRIPLSPTALLRTISCA